MKCVVCSHRGSDVSYFRFAADPERLRAWLIHLKIKRDEISSHSLVCSNHFQEDCFERDLKGELLGKKTKRTLKPDALPTRPKDKRKARQPNRWISNKEQQASTSQLIN
jgi:hypothetical protein